MKEKIVKKQELSKYSGLISQISTLLQQARQYVASQVNTTMVQTYWHI
jgi:hypothetical protein